MRVYVQILGTETEDSSPSILLFFDNYRYLFNCGEGIQRFSVEHGIKLLKLNFIFLTHISWKSIGGLPGILLTLGDAGARGIGIGGPVNTLGAMETFRYFLNRKDLQLDIREFETGEDVFEDEVFAVHPIVVSIERVNFDRSGRLYDEAELDSSAASHRERWGTPQKDTSFVKMVGSGRYEMRLKFFHDGKAYRGPHRKLVRAVERLDVVCCYACHFPDKKGKFDVRRSNELGVPVNKRSALVRGESVVLDDGTVVHSHECVGPSTPGKIALVVHCPRAEFAVPLMENPGFKPYYKDGKLGDRIACIIHITIGSVVEDEKYKNWMARFLLQTEHIIVTREHCKKTAIFQSFAHNSMLLNRLDSTIFPKHHEESNDRDLPETKGLNLIAADPLLKYHIFPRSELDYSGVLMPLSVENGTGKLENGKVESGKLENKKVESGKVENEKVENEKVESGKLENKKVESEKVKNEKVENEKVENEKLENEKLENGKPEIIFLGTGAAIPCKYRNVSCTCLRIGGRGNILLDVGENSLGQMFRCFGKEGLENVLRSLKCIFISHMHADHHIGVVGVLARRWEYGIVDPMVVVGPEALNYFLEEYGVFERLDYIYCDSKVMSCDSACKSGEELVEKIRVLFGLEMVTIPVIHCPDAYGVSMVHECGWKIVFSGDTRPCELLESVGRGCDILIHEATFEDSLSQEAVHKGHSTISEALGVARRMGARFLLMTHFSQRYPRLPILGGSEEVPLVAVAFDMMVVGPLALGKLPSMLEDIRRLFKGQEAADDNGDVEGAQITRKKLKFC